AGGPAGSPRWWRARSAVRVVACLLVGGAPASSIGPSLAAAAQPVVGTLPEYSLAVWHGFHPPFFMSLVAIGGGIAVYLRLRPHQQAGRFADPPGLGRVNGRRVLQRPLIGRACPRRRPSRCCA